VLCDREEIIEHWRDAVCLLWPAVVTYHFNILFCM
jgi:hypothetical protein